MRQKVFYITILVVILSCNESPKTNTTTETKEFPTKTVRIIEPFGTGGGPDIIARTISPKLSELWGQRVTVENHPGDGSTAAPALVAKSSADGYTLLINTSAHAYSWAFLRGLPYDPLKDFIPVAALTTQPYVLVTGRSSGIKTISGLIAKAKKNELKFGSTGIGTGTHIGLEKFNLEAGVKAIHVPAQPGESINDVISNTIAGRIIYIMSPIQLAMKHIQKGDLIALGITTKQRSNLLSNTPTIAETGLLNFDYPIWYGIWAPAGTPDKIVDQLSKDFMTVLSIPAIQDSLTKHGASVINMTRREFSKFILSESEMAANIIKSANIKH